MQRRWLAAVVAYCACGDVKDNPRIDASTDSAVADAEIDSPPPECTLGTTSLCSGNDLVTCDGQGTITATTSCPLGCSATSAPHCKIVQPSNNLGAALAQAFSESDLELVGDATINTDAGTITDTTGVRVVSTETLSVGLPVQVFLMKVKAFTAGSITVTGARALAIVASGPVTLNRPINLSASQDISGPGAASCQGGTGAGNNAEGTPGGGGGGFGTIGGTGGTGGSPLLNGGIGGAVAGNPELVPLRGGCAGGHSGGNGPSAAGGPDPGGAGGAIQIVSNVSITFAAAGEIVVNGGAGKANSNTVFCLIDTPCGFGEGGGSGGAILLEAPLVTVPSGAGLYANGGGGSCGITGAGQAGQRSTTPAAGQTCSGQNGNGGNGSTGTIAATSGGNKSGLDSIGGGGGGGAGRIRINLIGSSFAPGGTISPPPSLGVLSAE